MTNDNFLMLVQQWPLGQDLDKTTAPADGHWQATPQARIERLLLKTQVPAGLLFNGTELRLVYAPHGESSGYMSFRVKEMAEVAGRPIFAGLHTLLEAPRLFSMAEKQRLPAILADSRKYQNVVSTQLAEQVLAALFELLRGFQAADAQRQGQLLREVLAADPNHVYGGLLNVLMRLVFILYAEDRGLLSSDPVYANFYSVTGLFERLREDAGRYPDTMDQRYGAWAQLLTLFRLIYDGGQHDKFHVPPRRGYLFDPDRYPFLEGRTSVVSRQLAVAKKTSVVSRQLAVGKTTDHGQLTTDNCPATTDNCRLTLSAKLVAEYGRGFGARNLANMTRFAETFPDEQIVAALSQQLSWSHFVEIIPLDTPLKRDFYAEMCRLERWSVRTLRHKIDHLLFERTAVAKKPEKLIEQDLAALRDEDRLTPDLVFRDPYLLDFLGLTGSYSEKDVEQAVLRELEAFILELGTDFAFVARQKRMTVDDVDYYLDLLFYHRRLRRLVAIDLKIGQFQAADKGQMELYLRWLEEYEMQPGEEPPLGLILCAGKTEGHVRLLKLEESGIHAAQYLTELPPQEVLERKLLDAIRLARERLARQAQESMPAPRLPQTKKKPPPAKARKRKTTDH